MKLTQPEIDKLPPGEYRDDEVPGLVLRVRASKRRVVRSYVLRYTRLGGGAQPRPKLGDAAVMKLTDARKAAKTLLSGIWTGADPAEALRLQELGPITLGDLADKYLAEAKLSPATRVEWRRLADVELKPLLARPAAAVTRAEFRGLVEAKARTSGWVANRLFQFSRRLYTWGIAKDLLPPAAAGVFAGMTRPMETERASDRVLSADELRALVFVLDELRKPKRMITYRDGKTGAVKSKTRYGGDHYADALALLMLTGVRRRAVLEARASELVGLEAPDERDGQASTAEWRIEPERQKIRESKRAKAKPHVVPLSRQAADLFRHRLRSVGGADVLFPRVYAARGGEAETTWWKASWVKKLNAMLSERLGAPMEPWKVHNLRHTMATHIEGELGVDEKITPGILGHVSGRGVTGRYALAVHMAARRKALQDWADWLDSLRRSSFKVAEGGRA